MLFYLHMGQYEKNSLPIRNPKSHQHFNTEILFLKRLMLILCYFSTSITVKTCNVLNCKFTRVKTGPHGERLAGMQSCTWICLESELPPPLKVPQCSVSSLDSLPPFQ